MKLGDRFNQWASRFTEILGSFPVVILSFVSVIVWAITGPLFNFSDTWQLFINTSTTVVTFWMVFIIQNSANRDAKAVHLKLDELIRSSGARNDLIHLEKDSDAKVKRTDAELTASKTENPRP